MARTNRYAQDCAVCAGRVAKGAGVLERGDGGRWLVRHPECAGVDPESLEAPAERSGVKLDSDGVPIARVRGYGGRYEWRRGYAATGHRCEDAPCCGCCD